MEDPDTEFRTILVKITDRISSDELDKLRFIFSDKIKRDDGNNNAIDLFRQLLDRGIIDKQNLSKLIIALDNVGCCRAAQILRDYQFPTLTITVPEIVRDEIYSDNEPDKISTHEFDPRQDFLLNNKENTTSKLTIYGKTNTKPKIIKYLMFLIIFLTYTVALIVVIYYLIIPKLSKEKNPLTINNKSICNRAKFCQPSLSERYFIKSRYSGKLIGVINTTSEQGEQLYQWHFIPLSDQGQDKIYVIQSVYNRKVFDVLGGNSSNDNRIQQLDMVMNNINQQFRLIYISQEDSCLIQSLATNKVLNADLQINEKTSMMDQNKTLWQLIPFDIDRPGDKLIDCPYVSSINDLTVIKFGHVFGSDDGGHSTDDSKNSKLTISHYISSISIISSDWVNSIEFIYSSSNTLSMEPSKSGVIRGSIGIYSNNNNNRNEIFNVTEKSSNERIDRVYLVINVGRDYSKVSARYIVGIQFHTTFNRTSSFYGSRQGQLYIEEYSGFVLGYVRGGAHMHIERLQFIWYKA